MTFARRLGYALGYVLAKLARPVSRSPGGHQLVTVTRARPLVKARTEPGRNDPCPCDSGKKFKKCHGRGQPIGADAYE